MEANGKAISSRQFLCMAFIGGMVIKMFMLPSLLVQVCGRDGAVVMLVYLAVEICNLALIAYLIKKYPDLTFFDALKECFGCVISRIIAGVILLAIFTKFVLNLSEIKAFFSTSMFSSIKWEIMIIPLIVTFAIMAVKSLRVIGRTAEIIMPIMLVGIALIMLIVVREAPIKNALPILENGLGDTINGISTFPVWFGDVTVLVVAMGNLKGTRGLVWKTVLVRLSVALIVLTFSVVLFATYGNVTTVIGYGHNVTSLTQYNLGSQEFGRFDLIVYSLWLLGVFLKVAINFYFAVRVVSFIINRDCYGQIAIALSVLSYVLTLFVFPTQSAVFTLSTGWAKYPFAVVEYLTPIALVVATAIRYRKKGRESK